MSEETPEEKMEREKREARQKEEKEMAKIEAAMKTKRTLLSRLVVFSVFLINYIFLGMIFLDKSYPENSLIALLVMNAILLGLGILSLGLEIVLTGHILGMKKGKIVIEKILDDAMEKRIIRQARKILKKSTTKKMMMEAMKTTVIAQGNKAEISEAKEQTQAARVEATEQVLSEISKTTSGILFDTNNAYDQEAVWDMIKNNKISAYGGVRHLVDTLKINDTIFFYQSGKGIIAAGRVTSETHEVLSNNKKVRDDEKYRTVKFLTAIPNKDTGIQKYLIPKEITAATDGLSFSYIRTIKYPILDEKQSKALLAAVKKEVDAA